MSVHEIKTLYPYKFAYVDKAGHVIIDASDYQAVGPFSEGLATVWSVNAGWGFIDKTGKIAIGAQFQRAHDFSEGLAGVSIGGLWGFIDKTGRVVIKPQYLSVSSFSEGIAVVVRDSPDEASPFLAKDHTIQNETSSEYIASLTKAPIPFRNADKAQQRGENETSFIDRTGKTIVTLNMDKLRLDIHERPRFSEGLINVYDSSTGKVGFIDKTGNFVIEPIYDQGAGFSEGLARVAVAESGEEKIGFIDHKGQFAIAPQFNTDADFSRNSTDFSEGLASLTEGLRPTVTEEAKFAYIDKQGKIVLPTSFFYAGRFRDGVASVYDDLKNKYGFINKNGTVVIPIKYDSVSDFSEGLAYVAILTN
jgi:hypothetical protein